MSPVVIFKLYKSKLNPDCDSLWQKTSTSQRLHYTDEVWYEARVVRCDMLECYMKINLPRNVRMDGEYTNHSIHATVIQRLDNAGFEAHHIMSVSGHKNESSIKEYATNCPEIKKRANV